MTKPQCFLLIAALVSVIALVVLIARFKINPFIVR